MSAASDISLDAWRGLLRFYAQGGLLGAPFAVAGRGPDAWDCWGLCLEALTRLGRPVPTDLAETAARLYQAQGQFFPSTAVWTQDSYHPADQAQGWHLPAEPRPGDLMALSRNQRLHHVGLITPYGVLHAAIKTGSILQSYSALRASGYGRQVPLRWTSNPEAAHG